MWLEEAEEMVSLSGSTWLEEAEELVQGTGSEASEGVRSARRALFCTPKRATGSAQTVLDSAEELLRLHTGACTPRGGASPSRLAKLAAGDVLDRAEVWLQEVQQQGPRSPSAGARAGTVRLKRSLLVRADEAELSRRNLARIGRILLADGHLFAQCQEAVSAHDPGSSDSLSGSCRPDNAPGHRAEDEQRARWRRQRRAQLLLRENLTRALQSWQRQAVGAKQAAHLEAHVLREAAAVQAAVVQRDSEREAQRSEAADAFSRASLARFAFAFFSKLMITARDIDGLAVQFRVARECKGAWQWWLRALAAFRVECESQARAAQRKKKLDALVKGLSTRPRPLHPAAPQLADTSHQLASRAGAKKTTAAAHAPRTQPCPQQRAPASHTRAARLGASNTGATSSAAFSATAHSANPHDTHAYEGAAEADNEEQTGQGHGDARQLSCAAGFASEAEAGRATYTTTTTTTTTTIHSNTGFASERETGRATCSTHDIAQRPTARTRQRASGHDARPRTTSLNARRASPGTDEAKRCREVKLGHDKALKAMLDRQMLRAERRQALHVSIHTHTHTHTNTYMHTYIHTYIHTCIRMYVHTFIHSYIHK
jgi:hypothetical protein